VAFGHLQSTIDQLKELTGLMEDYVEVQGADTRMDQVEEAVMVAAKIKSQAVENTKFFSSYLEQART